MSLRAGKSKSDDHDHDIEATAQQGFDAAWLRNAVEEPLDEGDIQWRKEDS